MSFVSQSRGVLTTTNATGLLDAPPANLVPQQCFHCALEIPAGLALTVSYAGVDQAVCCTGCQAVAELIIQGGQGDYYQYRDAVAPRPPSTVGQGNWQPFELEVSSATNGLCQATLWIDGIHCGACGWLIEHQLSAMQGVSSISVDQQTGIAQLSWNPAALEHSKIVQRIHDLGYHPHPLKDSAVENHQQQEKARFLKRLALAGLGMMQVSMFAVGTYFGPGNGMDPAVERLLYLVSMLVAAPVVFYSGSEFFAGAWRSLKAAQLSMDVPVSLALLLAFGASSFNFFRGQGPMFFESATMFVFLLLSARFIAMGVRHRALDAQLALLPMLPDTVIKISNGEPVTVPRSAICSGDLIRIRPGDQVAADGVVEGGSSSVNEALMTGESEAKTVNVGDTLLAGSANIDGSVDLRVTHTGKDSSLAGAAALLDQARADRPQTMVLANRLAGMFVGAVLVIATGVFFYWLPMGFEAAFTATLAVLVVTCPCALSLAIPAGLSAATTALAREGLLVARLEALEVLTRATCIVLDKTGTLSQGRPTISTTTVNPAHPKGVTQERLLTLMAALEKHSNHPLAAAFGEIECPLTATDVVQVPGRGIRGSVDGRQLRLGNSAFTGDLSGLQSPLTLADRRGVLGWAEVIDPWREDAHDTIKAFSRLGLRTVIASGDDRARVQAATHELGMDQGHGELLAADKLALLTGLKQQGYVVMAVGDGVNDSGLLGGADVSIAMAEGADLAKASADIVLTGTKLKSLLRLRDVALDSRRIIRQNLAWALTYNLLAVPFAASGMIGPGLSALGMSISSLMVIGNAARLSRTRSDTATKPVLPAPEALAGKLDAAQLEPL